MKKVFISISSLFVYLFLALPAFAEAKVINPCEGATGIANVLCGFSGAGGENIGKTIQGVVVFFIIIAVVVALIYLLYGGVKWITSKGDKTEVEAARNHIMAAIIGLIVVVLAVFILTIILSALGLDWATLKIPVIGKT